MKRRTVLGTVASTTAVLAGCLARDGSGDDGSSDGNESDDEDGGDSSGGSTQSGEPAGGSGDDSGSNGETNSTDDTPDDDTQASVTDRGIETTVRDCGSQDTTSASMQVDGQDVVVEGTLSASTPCHDAVLSEASVEDGTLRVRIDLSERDGVCQQCIGEISYRATVTVDSPSALQSVAVVHATGGEHSFDVE